jgi:hypothetical protein
MAILSVRVVPKRRTGEVVVAPTSARIARATGAAVRIGWALADRIVDGVTYRSIKKRISEPPSYRSDLTEQLRAERHDG